MGVPALGTRISWCLYLVHHLVHVCEQVPVGQIGEVCIQGPNVTKGYLNNPKANAEAYAGGAHPVKCLSSSPDNAWTSLQYSRSSQSNLGKQWPSERFHGLSYMWTMCRLVPHGRPGVPGRGGLPHPHGPPQGAHQPRRRENLAPRGACRAGNMPLSCPKHLKKPRKGLQHLRAERLITEAYARCSSMLQ